MKKGILIVNAFLNATKYTEIYEWLSTAAKKVDIDLKVMANAEFMAMPNCNKIIPPVPENDFILFWDKDIHLAEAFSRNGYKVFNNPEAIAYCDNKALTFERLAGKVRMPKTIRIPMTFTNIGYKNFDFLDVIEKELGYPFIIKECCGSFGAQVYMASDRDDAIQILNKTGGRESIAQEFIRSTKNRDIRIHTVGDKVVTSMMRYNKDDFRANITNGGAMIHYEPTDEQIKMAIEVTKLLGLDFAGVDILFGENNEPILCEVNSNAHFKNIFDCTGVNVADKIMEYISQQI